MKKHGSLVDLGEGLVQRALHQGSDEAEVYIHQIKGTTIQVRDGRPVTIHRLNTSGVGLRVFIGKRLGYAYTSDLSPAGYPWLIQEAVGNASHNTPDQYNGLPESREAPVDLPWLYDPECARTPFRLKVEMAMELESAASRISRICKIISCSFTENEQNIIIINSKGIHLSYRATIACGSVEVMLQKDGENQTGLGFTWARTPSKLVPEAAATEAVERARILLGSKPCQTGRVPVILTPRVTARLLAQLARVLTGEAEQKQRSLFRGQLGAMVASPAVNIVDHPLYREGMASRPFDAEGVASRCTTLISKGKLVSFLHNAYTGRRAGTGSTASATRSSYRMTPEVGISNLILLPGTLPATELMELAGNGLLVTELQGAHTINPITGRFSVGAAGVKIEHGQPAQPVHRVALVGDFRSLLRQIVAVGNDLHLHPEYQGIGAPSVLVESLTVVGS